MNQYDLLEWFKTQHDKNPNFFFSISDICKILKPVNVKECTFRCEVRRKVIKLEQFDMIVGKFKGTLNDWNRVYKFKT